jgi:hypothetical protein
LKGRAEETTASTQKSTVARQQNADSGFGLADILLGSTGQRGGRRQGVLESAAKSAASTIGREVGRQLIRGVLGSLLGGGRKR